MIKFKCNFCKKIFFDYQYKKKRNKYHFCNKTCQHEFFKNTTHPSWKHGKSVMRCDWCNKHFEKYETQIGINKFCSEQCYHYWQSVFQIGENSNRYINGSSNEPYIKEFNKELKEQIRKRDNYKCRLCGRNQRRNLVLFKEILSIHHIDYDKSHADPKKLVSLCKSCNIKVNSNRDYWFAYFSYILELFYA